MRNLFKQYVNNMLREYNEMEEERKNPKNAVEYTK